MRVEGWKGVFLKEGTALTKAEPGWLTPKATLFSSGKFGKVWRHFGLSQAGRGVGMEAKHAAERPIGHRTAPTTDCSSPRLSEPGLEGALSKSKAARGSGSRGLILGFASGTGGGDLGRGGPCSDQSSGSHLWPVTVWHVGKTGCTLAPGGQLGFPEVLTFEPRIRWCVIRGLRNLGKGHSKRKGPEAETS